MTNQYQVIHFLLQSRHGLVLNTFTTVQLDICMPPTKQNYIATLRNNLKHGTLKGDATHVHSHSIKTKNTLASTQTCSVTSDQFLEQEG
jgi:hypothetical protein